MRGGAVVEVGRNLIESACQAICTRSMKWSVVHSMSTSVTPAMLLESDSFLTLLRPPFPVIDYHG